ncbi:hypothetical protein OIU85_002014 [Salix viminalis]|uniref:Mitochondrial inner membrane protease ATP23 n=1 Tax=Salix viminalis TaxID=40686 RepID=A0A9Q0VN63_SALVM|nr:hypothetical protein OIU85_002014 [Salix viminalis]
MAEEPGTTPGPDGATVEECEDMIRRSFRTPMIAGGYVRGEGIMVCSNHMITQDDVNQVVKHELIHAYDDCRAANLDWADCAHHACSEIRAGHLSGDCHYKRELLRGYMKLRGHEQDENFNLFIGCKLRINGYATFSSEVSFAFEIYHHVRWKLESY